MWGIPPAVPRLATFLLVFPFAIGLLFGCSVEGGEGDPSELSGINEYASVWNERSDALDSVGADFASACNPADGDPETCASLADEAGEIVKEWISALAVVDVPASMEVGHDAAMLSLEGLDNAFGEFSASIERSDAAALQAAIDDLGVAFQELEEAYALYPDAGLRLVVW